MLQGLKESSVAFKRGTKELKDKMWWKQCKMKLLIAGLVTAVLIIIIVPIAVQNSKKNSN